MKQRHIKVLGLAFAFLAIASCSPSSKPATAAPLPDGLPSIARAWTVADYPQAAGVLTQLPAAQLPRSGSGGDGAQFIDRLTSAEALAWCADRSSPVTDRIPRCLPVGDAANAILRHYATAMVQDHALADDTLRIQGFMLGYAEVMADLATEFMATISVDDPTYGNRLAGVDQMRRGFGQMLQGGAISLQAPGTFSEPVRADFARRMAHAFERLEADLPTDVRGQLHASFARIAASDSNEEVRAYLGAAGPAE